MNDRHVVTRVLEGVVLCLLLLVVVGGLLGQPVVVSYVETGSMEPTLEAGDGYIAIPAVIAGSPSSNDVVVFDAEQLHGGGLTTHRVVAEANGEYVTKGDANPFTDQDGGEPYVTDGQIAAHALQVDGNVVVIPHVGTVITAVQASVDRGYSYLAMVPGVDSTSGSGVTYVLFAVGAVMFVAGTVFDGDRRRERSRARRRTSSGYNGTKVVVAVAVTAALITGVTVLAGSGTEQVGVLSAEFTSESPTVVPAGETKQRPYVVSNDGLVPAVVALEPASDGITATPSQFVLDSRSTQEAALAVTAPSETGYQLQSIGVYRYPAVLPPSLLFGLHAVHPVFAGVAVVVTAGIAVAIPAWLWFGGDRIRLRDRRRQQGGNVLFE